jgi:hypothetical protein
MFAKFILILSLSGLPLIIFNAENARSIRNDILSQKSQEQKQNSGQKRNARKAHELPEGCAKNRKGRTSKTRARRDEIQADAANSGISAKEIDDLQQITQQQVSTLAEDPVLRQTEEEIEFKNSLVQSQIVTPAGTIRCSASDEYTDRVMDSSNGVNFIGGPLDNQQ